MSMLCFEERLKTFDLSGAWNQYQKGDLSRKNSSFKRSSLTKDSVFNNRENIVWLISENE